MTNSHPYSLLGDSVINVPGFGFMIASKTSKKHWKVMFNEGFEVVEFRS